MNPAMRVVFCFFFMFSTWVSFTQSVQRSTVGMGGSTTTIQQGDQTYYVSSSIGQQSVIGTYKSGEHTVRQGFQQSPITVLSTSFEAGSIDATVFPNPVQSTVTIAFDEVMESQIEGVIYDILGKEVHAFSKKPALTIDLDLTHLSAGTYSLVVVADQRNFTTRLLKN